MSDPFRQNVNRQLMREARAGLTVLVLLLTVLFYVAFHRMTGRNLLPPENIISAPMATRVVPADAPATQDGASDFSLRDYLQKLGQRQSGQPVAASAEELTATSISPASGRPERRIPTTEGTESAGKLDWLANWMGLAGPPGATESQPTSPRPGGLLSARADAGVPAFEQSPFPEPTPVPSPDDSFDSRDDGFAPRINNPVRSDLSQPDTQVRVVQGEFPVEEPNQDFPAREVDSGPHNSLQSDASFSENEFRLPPVDPTTKSPGQNVPGTFFIDEPVSNSQPGPTDPAVSTETLSNPDSGEFSARPSMERSVQESPEQELPSVPNSNQESLPSSQELTTAGNQRLLQQNAQPLNPSRPYYQTRANESYWSICQKVYGDGRLFRALYRQNSDRLPRFDDLEPGTTLEIPDATTLINNWPADCPPDLVATPPSSRSGTIYVTRKNDTLFDISRRQLGQAALCFEIGELNRDLLPSGATHLTPLPAGLRLTLPR